MSRQAHANPDPDIQGSIVGLFDSGTSGLTKIGYLSFGENPGLTPGGYRYTGRATTLRRSHAQNAV